MTRPVAVSALLAVLLCCATSVGAQQAAGALPATTAADPTGQQPFTGEVAFAAPPVNETLANATLGCDSPCYVVKDTYPFKTCKPECNAQTCSRGELAACSGSAGVTSPGSAQAASLVAVLKLCSLPVAMLHAHPVAHSVPLPACFPLQSQLAPAYWEVLERRWKVPHCHMLHSTPPSVFSLLMPHSSHCLATPPPPSPPNRLWRVVQ
jgi:hypothetical protein